MRERERERDRDRETDRQTDRDRERQRERGRHTETESGRETGKIQKDGQRQRLIWIARDTCIFPRLLCSAFMCDTLL